MIEDVDGRLVPAPPKTAARVVDGRLVPATPAARASSRDCYVVETAELAPVVRGFVSRWNQQRPSDASRFRPRGTASLTAASSFVSPYEWLERESGVDRRTLRDIARGTERRRFTPLREADAIAHALGNPGLLSPTNGIRVVEHPRGCGGRSLTGDGRTRG